MDDTQSDTHHRTPGQEIADQFTELPYVHGGQVDVRLLLPLAVVSVYGVIILGLWVTGLDLPVPMPVILIGAWLLAWACVDTGWRIMSAEDRTVAIGGRWSITNRTAMLIGWLTVSAALMGGLDAISYNITAPYEGLQLAFAILCISVILSSIVGGPLIALSQLLERSKEDPTD